MSRQRLSANELHPTLGLARSKITPRAWWDGSRVYRKLTSRTKNVLLHAAERAGSGCTTTDTPQVYH
jgi:hypothetical protein